MSDTMILNSASLAEDLTTPFVESTTSIFSKMLGWDIEWERPKSRIDSNRIMTSAELSESPARYVGRL
jgi:hypothetical protein